MYDLNFIFTDDGSVGLYDKNVQDIYHSKTGALKEAIDKFINPSFLENTSALKKTINILDICYGIGYNTKAALHRLSDNILIDCLDMNKSLALLSPFIKDSINDVEMKLFLFSETSKFINSFDEITSKLNFYLNNENSVFFDEDICDFVHFFLSSGYVSNVDTINLSFLHNIYYNYVSQRDNSGLKFNKYKNSKINFYFDDARKSIIKLNKTYDIVFLDGFSPQKLPTLWTIDFLSKIKDKMNNDSILVSYSKSTPFRSALNKLGFYVGKTFIDDIDMGTVASFSKEKIVNPLSQYDLELLSTRSGITYKDKYLNLSPDEILKNRINEQYVSNKISHTAFLKKYKQ